MNAGKLMKSPFSIVLIAIVSVVAVFSAFNLFLPPISVVESGSMQHSDTWVPGTINTGDLIFQKNVSNPLSQITTYVQGRTTDFSAYGDFGNVIMYISPDNFSIVHRAMLYVEWNGTQPIIPGYENQTWISVNRDAVIIKDVGYSHRNLVVYLDTMVGKTGYITMGDNNLGSSGIVDNYSGAYVAADQDIFGYPPVNASQIAGISWGLIPWAGLIKLNILKAQGEWNYSDEVPRYSYYYLFFSSAAVFAGLAFSAYYLENMITRSGAKKSG